MALARALAASVTPLRASGSELDDAAFGPARRLLRRGRARRHPRARYRGRRDPLEERERRIAADLFLQAASTPAAGRRPVRRADDRRRRSLSPRTRPRSARTRSWSSARRTFQLDERAQHAHFLAAAHGVRAAPVLRLRVRVDERLRRRSGRARAPARATRPNLVGLKVSDTPFDALLPLSAPRARHLRRAGGVDPRGTGGGRRRCGLRPRVRVSGDVAAVVRNPSSEGAARLAELRAFVERFPRQAALKRLLGRQGVPGARGRARTAPRAHQRGARRAGLPGMRR